MWNPIFFAQVLFNKNITWWTYVRRRIDPAAVEPSGVYTVANKPEVVDGGILDDDVGPASLFFVQEPQAFGLRFLSIIHSTCSAPDILFIPVMANLESHIF